VDCLLGLVGVEMLEREGLSQLVLVCEGCCWWLVKISAGMSLSFYPSLVKEYITKQGIQTSLLFL
jgi:hypothetical protein